MAVEMSLQAREVAKTSAKTTGVFKNAIGYLRLRAHLACRNTSTLMRRPLKIIELLTSMIGWLTQALHDKQDSTSKAPAVGRI